MLKSSDFDYQLPERLIAQTPSMNREESRLLHYNRKTQNIEHRFFYNIIDYLNKGDLLVVNSSRVMPARLLGNSLREDGSLGGKIEFLLLNCLQKDRWEILVKPGKRAKIGTYFSFTDKLRAKVIDQTQEGGRIVEFYYDGIWQEILDELGQMPLPPYITQTLEDKERYQTVYSKEVGSAAAPTAGLHFSKLLLQQIQSCGVHIANIVLHVGLGTFRPVKVEDITQHKMHSEYCEIPEDTASRIAQTRNEGHRVIAVGTTTCRTLESMSNNLGEVTAGNCWTDIFIAPGYKFKVVDALITNFHLPKSTLLMLISAFAGREEMLRAYEEAMEEEYRFFSFGDAMMIE